jgi:hypothetical protein
VYVVLANVSQTLESTYGQVICGPGMSTLVAIDTTTNKVASLGGTGPMGSIALTYVNPLTLVFDATNNRVIVVQSGCYAMPGSQGSSVGSPSHGGVEAVDLASGQTSPLLPLVASAFPAGFVAFPTGFAYIDANHAVIGFDATGEAVYSWDPTMPTLGAVIPNAPDIFTYDGKGNLLGSRVDLSGGAPSTAIVSVAIATGASTTLATNVTDLTGMTYVSSVDVWPHP